MERGRGHPPSMDTAPAPRRFVAYTRVSTDRQGRSGLGLEAQRVAINGFLRPGDRLLAPIFTEVETGKREDRPELAKALAKCRQTGAVLLIARLDRLARNAHFLLGLQASGVEFVACDMQHANRLTIGILALVAEEEARAVSSRTRAALQAARARGTVLGGVRKGQRAPTADEQRQGAQAGAETVKMAADHAAHAVAPRILELREAGASLATIAATLTAEGVATPRGGSWTATSVRRAVARLEGAQAAA